MSEQTRPKFLTPGGWALFVVLPLAIGLLLSLLIQQPQIGVIYLNQEINSYSAQEVITQITYARDHAEIKAVVLVLNSPGGTVTDTESVYLELARLRQDKPVITVVEGMAASGAYYLAVGTDYILAKPSSMVGNIGIIGSLPYTPIVYEETLSTGPYKLWGSPRDTYMREMEAMKQSFLSAVKLGRGTTLKTDDETILRGQIWVGSEALQMGLIDALGVQSDAMEKAAQMAHISHFKVVDLYTSAGVASAYSVPYYSAENNTESQVSTTPVPREAGLYYLYDPSMEVNP